MNEFTHVIITYTGVHHYVSQEQAESAALLRKDEERKIAGNLLKGANIADIVTKEKYFESFPKKRDLLQTEMFPTSKQFLPEPKEEISKRTNIAGLRQMIKGVERYIKSSEANPRKNIEGKPAWYKGTQEPYKLLERLEKELAKKLADNKN